MYICIVLHWAGNKMGDSSNDSSSDENICDYERQRLKNIKENQDLLHSLGKTRVCIAMHLLLLLLLLFSLILLLLLFYLILLLLLLAIVIY